MPELRERMPSSILWDTQAPIASVLAKESATAIVAKRRTRLKPRQSFSGENIVGLADNTNGKSTLTPPSLDSIYHESRLFNI